MKNKKLFAILTLVCFMFTLMPVAAFAAGEYVVAQNGKDTISVDAAATTNVTASVTGSAASFYFWAENTEEEVVALGSGVGHNEFAFDAAGTYYVYAVDIANGADAPFAVPTATKANIINTVKDRYAADIVNDFLTVKVKNADVTYTIAPSVSNVTIKADNGWTAGGEMYVTLTNAVSGNPVRGEEVTFKTNSAYVDVILVDDVTDRSGRQDIKITATKAGDYKVYASYKDADRVEIGVHVDVEGVTSIKTVAEPQRAVALDSVFNFGYGLSDIAFDIAYADGTKATSALTKGTDYKITVVEAPVDSAIDAADLSLNYDAATNKAYVLYGATSLDEEGTYTFKVTLKNGASATATVKVVEFDEPVMMSLTYPTSTIALGEPGLAKKSLAFIDAKGTVLSIAHPDYASMPVVEYAANGKAVTGVGAGVSATGTVSTVAYTADTKALVGTKVNVLAICEELELTATAELTVVDKAASLKYAKTTADIAVNNDLIVNTVDADGNVVSAGFDATDVATTASVYVLSAPANAAYYVAADVTDVDEVTVSFTASAAGEYKLQTVVRHAGAYYSSVDTIVVGGTAGQFKDVVVMSIGANNIVVNSDVKAITAAPMIQDNRTFVPFRALAEAFGADVEWVEATQSVVAELNGVKVVMNIGENAYTVNGAAKTADVAPFINGASTMVPVRFVAEAFGINVTPIAAADGTIADVLFAK